MIMIQYFANGGIVRLTARRMLRGLESKIFCIKFGTSEASSKYIPITADILRSIKRTSVRQLLSLAQYNFPPEFF